MLKDLTLENLHHAYLLLGDIKTLYSHLSKWFLSHGIETSGNSNFLEISTTTFLIDHAREVKRFVSEKSTGGQRKYIVIRTEYFSHPAQHALLKTVEEPGEDVTIFILVPRKHLVLPTILSRVVQMSLVGGGEEDSVSELDALSFAKAKPAERLKVVDSFLKNHKNDENSSEMKGEVNKLLIDLEDLWNKGSQRESKKLKDIWFVKNYLHDQGSSVKMLFEYLAVNL